MEKALSIVVAAILAVLHFNWRARVHGIKGCDNYKYLNESNRATTFYNTSFKFRCDGKLSGWYRFGGDAGKQMADSCVPKYRCGTEIPGWLNGSHPVVADGAVQRKVCFNYQNDCCSLSTSVSVLNCGGFYVYNFKSTRKCNLRYCGDGIHNKPGIKTKPTPFFTALTTVPASSPLTNKSRGITTKPTPFFTVLTTAPTTSPLTNRNPGALQCPLQVIYGVLWSATIGGQTVVKPCPNGARGTTSRKCSKAGVWKNANFTGCSSADFIKLADMMRLIMGGLHSELNVKQVLSMLSNVTKPRNSSSISPAQIYGGDLIKTLDILFQIAEYNAKFGNVSSKDDFGNYVQVGSNLLEPVNRGTWMDLVDGQDRSQMIVNTMDSYGLGVAATFNTSTEVDVFQSATKHLMMRVDLVDQDSPLRHDGLQVAYNQNSIFLPPGVFHPSLDSRIVTLVYLTLGDVLSLQNETGDKASTHTTIVSSTVYPRPRDALKNPVKVILQNRKVSSPDAIPRETQCVFWRPKEAPIWKTSGCQLVPSESNSSMTTCECDHLTIFAALMDPYRSTMAVSNKNALEIISIVGCSISLLAVVITMAVTLFFWRELKGPRVKVLLNLCAAIAFSCAVVILEGHARHKEPECTVMAALLHYFLLALFSWMLCEGILHYIITVKVLQGDAEDKVKFFYLFGWGFPALMVIISLSVARAEGYGHKAACWLTADKGLIWAFIVPAIGVILVNIMVFILVIRQMLGTKYMQNKTQVEKVRAGVKASAVILPLLGITWLFGLLSFNSDTIIFKYIFTIFNSLQGLLIFIFHCVLNKQVKDAIKKRRKRFSDSRRFSKNHSKRKTSTPKKKLEVASIPGHVAPSGLPASLTLNPISVAAENPSNFTQNGDKQLPEAREIRTEEMKFISFIRLDVNQGAVEGVPLEVSVNLAFSQD